MKHFTTAVSLIIAIMLALSAGFTALAEDNTAKALLIVRENITGSYLKWTPDMAIEPDSTVLSLFDDSGLNVLVDDDGNIVGIGDYADGQYGDDSSWSCYIDGQEISIPEADYVLSAGDRVELIYNAPSYVVTTTRAPEQTDTTSTSQPSETSTEFSTEISTTAQPTTTAPASKTTAATYISETAANIINEDDAAAASLNYIRTNKGDYTYLALARYNQDIASSAVDEYIAAFNAQRRRTEEMIAKTIINGAAMGLDTKTAFDVDLQNLLKNAENIISNGLSGAIFGRLALAHCDINEGESFVNTADRLTSIIMQNQNDDGGFSETYGEQSETGITAMAVTALSLSSSRADVAAVIDKALLWLLNNQKQDGSFDSGDESDCAATAKVMIALYSLGLSEKDERFVKDNDIYAALLQFFNGTAFADDSGFEDTHSSEFALLALYSRSKSSDPFVDEFNYDRIFNMRFALIGLTAAVLVGAAAAFSVIRYKRRRRAADSGKQQREGSSSDV